MDDLIKMVKSHGISYFKSGDIEFSVNQLIMPTTIENMDKAEELTEAKDALAKGAFKQTNRQSQILNPASFSDDGFTMGVDQ